MSAALLVVLAGLLAVAGALSLYVLVRAETEEGEPRDRVEAARETRERVERRRAERRDGDGRDGTERD